MKIPAGQEPHAHAPGRRLSRPTSFYLLLAMPLVLLLGLHTLLNPGAPARVALGLCCLLVFFFVALCRALVDLLEILRSHLTESRLTYQETLGETSFVRALGARHQDAPPPGPAHDK